jgi:hypothetical protein
MPAEALQCSMEERQAVVLKSGFNAANTGNMQAVFVKLSVLPTKVLLCVLLACLVLVSSAHRNTKMDMDVPLQACQLSGR